MLPFITNLFELPNPLPVPEEQPEIFETLASGQGVLVERIISNGHITESGSWYEQSTDEWVLLLQGKATLMFDKEDGETLTLEAGQAIFIPALRQHRVIYTSQTPPCIWLAVHANLT